MTVARIIPALAAIYSALLISGCEQRSWKYGYRLTIEVQTPEGVRSGSSVLEVDIKKAAISFLDLSNGAVRYRPKGEATVVDLGVHGVLFAVLQGGADRTGNRHYAVGAPEEVFGRLGVLPKNNAEERWAQLEVLEGKAELMSEEFPYLVRFVDLNDPQSLTLVDPNNLTASFGPNVYIKRATIEMTHDRPTDDVVRKYLLWLNAVPDNYYLLSRSNAGSSISGPLGEMQKNSFIWGVQ